MSVRIYLGDLGYYNEYNFSQPTPLNVGYVASYLSAQLDDVDIHIFKNPVELLQQIREMPPAVIGLSHYQWNSNLNAKVFDEVKKANPNAITILGGPHLNATDFDIAAKFFRKRPLVDFHVEREGEATFSFLLKLLVERNCINTRADHDWSTLDVETWPRTLFSFNRDADRLVHNPAGDFDRLDLTTVPSPYLDGWMDKFLADKFLAPIIETNRGCPYSCSFCAWGVATQSKVRQFPLERVLEELRFVSTRTINPHKLLYLADANFGILKRDEDIAREIAMLKDKTGFPNQLYVYFAKNTNDRVIRVAELTRSVTMMSMSKQSINEGVLENIKRKNIPHQQYDDLRLECEKRGISTFSELIYGLPGETYDSFVHGVIQTVRQKAKIAIYPMLLIEGADNHTREYREMFGIKGKFRVLPRFISTMKDIHTMEYEEVAIENDVLSFEEWLKIREFHFVIIILSSEVFVDLKIELEVHDLDYATLAMRMIEDRESWPAAWQDLMDRFRQASVSEFIDEEDTTGHYDPDDITDIELQYPALNYYYFADLFSNQATLNAFNGYLLNRLSFLFPDAEPGVYDSIAQALQLSFDRMICYETLVAERMVHYKYDVERWSGDVNRTGLNTYNLGMAKDFTLSISDEVVERFNALRDNGLSLVDAVYKLRTGFIGYRGDVVFAYMRVPLSDSIPNVA